MGMNNQLRPVDLVNQPAPFQDRYKILHKLYDQLCKCYNRTGRSKRLELLAVKLEAQVAKSSKTPQSYRFTMGILFRDLLKYKGDLKKISIADKPLIGTSKITPSVITTKHAALEALGKLLMTEEQFKKNRFITRKKITQEDRTSSTTQLPDYVVCVRCGLKFQRKLIMTPATCRYHPMKKQYNKITKVYEYHCCGETSNSTSELRFGCKTYTHHVYKHDSYEELRQISSFVDTGSEEGQSNVLALDCEMGFTSLGYEMIRLTIVDFFTCETVFDRIVKPLGKVVDLNSEFSGVHKIDPNDCLTYGETITQVVGPDIINKNTILIGHGFENDLNVMRVTHDKVIDTSVLYPRGHMKRSLKDLSFELLSRKIQTGEHDSSQDAIATMDIIKKSLGISLEQKEWQ